MPALRGARLALEMGPRIPAGTGSELEADSSAQGLQPSIRLGEAVIPDMVDDHRHADLGCHLITELASPAAEKARAEVFASRRCVGQKAVMDRTAQAAVQKDAIARPEQIADQHHVQRQAEITFAGIAVGIERSPEMRPK